MWIRVMVFNATFNNISFISWRSVLLVEETGVPGENYRPTASHWQTLSHNVVSSTPRHEQDKDMCISIQFHKHRSDQTYSWQLDWILHFGNGNVTIMNWLIPTQCLSHRWLWISVHYRSHFQSLYFVALWLYFDIERTWWWSYQIRVVRAALGICVLYDIY